VYQETVCPRRHADLRRRTSKLYQAGRPAPCWLFLEDPSTYHFRTTAAEHIPITYRTSRRPMYPISVWRASFVTMGNPFTTVLLSSVSIS
jgi:hypothetical protein